MVSVRALLISLRLASLSSLLRFAENIDFNQATVYVDDLDFDPNSLSYGIAITDIQGTGSFSYSSLLTDDQRTHTYSAVAGAVSPQRALLVPGGGYCTFFQRLLLSD